MNPKPQALEATSMASQSSIVVEADFLGNAGLAVWNTPDCHRPTQDEVRGEGATLRTPLELGSIADLRSTLPPDSLVMAEGGTNGCDTWNHDDPTATPLEVGKRYVLFLVPGTDHEKHSLPDPTVLRALPVDDEGNVTTFSDGELSRSDLQDVLQAQPYTGQAP